MLFLSVEHMLSQTHSLLPLKIRNAVRGRSSNQCSRFRFAWKQNSHNQVLNVTSMQKTCSGGDPPYPHLLLLSDCFCFLPTFSLITGLLCSPSHTHLPSSPVSQYSPSILSQPLHRNCKNPLDCKTERSI